MTDEKPTIGFIGLGIMGYPMATNLIRAGYKVVAHNRSREPVGDLANKGATPAFSPREVAEKSSVIILCLPDSPDVQQVVAGPGGVLEGTSQGNIIIDMSTISPVVAVELAEQAAEQGIQMLDAPISGGDVGAKEGTLSIMIGGDAEIVEQVIPILEVLGSTITHVGSRGAGQMVKACNQIVVAGTLSVVAEALVLGAKAGVDPAKIVGAISGGAARCWALEVRAPNVIRRIFDLGFKSELHYKDLNIIMDAADAFKVPLPITSEVHELFKTMVVKGRGGMDHSAVITVIEDLAEVTTETHSG